MTKTRKRAESKLLADIRLAVGARPDFLVTRINVGVFDVAVGNGDTRSQMLGKKPLLRKIRTAPNGFPDLIGTQLRRVRAELYVEGGFMRHQKPYWHYYGQAIAIETKAKDGRLSEDQRNWAEAFTNMGGIYILARSLDDVYREMGIAAPEWSKTRPCPTEVE